VPRGTLELTGQGAIPSVINDPLIVTYRTDSDAIGALSNGEIDAVISGEPTLQQAIDDGSDIKIVGEALFAEELAIAFLKDAPLDSTSLADRVGEIIDEMHADGTLTALSEKWCGKDLTIAP
jgi:ABC-type amino acid transport substrate-binding protein